MAWADIPDLCFSEDGEDGLDRVTARHWPHARGGATADQRFARQNRSRRITKRRADLRPPLAEAGRL